MKTYTGPRTITAEYHPEETRRETLRREDGTWESYDEATGPEYVSRQAHWTGHIDGKTYYGLCGKTEADALAAAGRAAARMDADAAIYPAAKAVAATLTEEQADRLFPRFGTGDGDFHVGQTVTVYSRGATRVGLVEKVGRKNVTVVYVTASTGGLWRKAMPFDKVSFAAPDLGEE